MFEGQLFYVRLHNISIYILEKSHEIFATLTRKIKPRMFLLSFRPEIGNPIPPDPKKSWDI